MRVPIASTLVLLAVAPGAAADVWVGGVDLPGRYLFAVARLGAPGDAASLTFATGERADAVVQSNDPDDVRFTLDADGTTYLFRGRADGDTLSGALVPAGDDTGFPFRFVRIPEVPGDRLASREGTYAFDDGATWVVRAVEGGFLRLYDPVAGVFRNAYPESERSFFLGPGLDRPFPPERRVEFAEDRLTDSVRGVGVLAPAPAAPVRRERDVVRLGSGTSLELVALEAGEFTMGDPFDSGAVARTFGLPDSLAKEVPRRPVRLQRGFRIGRTEVTNAQFRAFVRDEAWITTSELEGGGFLWNGEGFDRVAGASWRNPGRTIADDEPVVMVSWIDADAFCRWLARRTGAPFRLPTEAEWEYACRAGTDGFFGFEGERGELDAYAWFGANSEGRPRPAGTRKTNAWGVHDMNGNVWEWCADGPGVVDRSSPAVDPIGPIDGDDRILRGGSWINEPFSCRCAYRPYEPTDLAEPHIGFRVALPEAD